MALHFKDYLVGALLIGIFISCLLAFGSGLAYNMGLDTGIMNSDIIDTSGLIQRVNETTKETDKYIESFKTEGLSFASGVLVALSIWNIIQLIFTSFGLIINTIVEIVSGALGLPNMVGAVLLSLIFIGLIFSAWKVIKQGE